MSEVVRKSLLCAFTRIVPVPVLLFAAPIVGTAGAQQTGPPAENPDHETYILPPPEVQELFATDKSYATLDNMSPDGDHFLVPVATELATLDLMARETYRPPSWSSGRVRVACGISIPTASTTSASTR